MSAIKLAKIFTTLILINIFVISACGSALKQKVPLKVMVFIPGDIADNNFSQAAYEGLKRFDKRKYKISYISNAAKLSKKKLFIKASKNYDRGFNVFIGVGSEFSELITQLAAVNHNAYYATVSGNSEGKNVVNFCLDCKPIGGCLAAAGASVLTKDKVVGFVGGIESIDGVEAKQFKKTLDGIDPDIKVLVHWVGSWSDIKLARYSANEQIKQGADVLVADANIGVILAAKKNSNIQTISWMFMPSDPDVRKQVAFSVVLKMHNLYELLFDKINNKQFIPGQYIVNRQDDIWDIKFNDDIVSKQDITIIKNHSNQC